MPIMSTTGARVKLSREETAKLVEEGFIQRVHPDADIYRTKAAVSWDRALSRVNELRAKVGPLVPVTPVLSKKYVAA